MQYTLSLESGLSLNINGQHKAKQNYSSLLHSRLQEAAVPRMLAKYKIAIQKNTFMRKF